MVQNRKFFIIFLMFVTVADIYSITVCYYATKFLSVMLWYASHDNKVRLSRSQFGVMVNDIDHLAVMHVGVPVTTRVLVFIDDSLNTQDI